MEPSEKFKIGEEVVCVDGVETKIEFKTIAKHIPILGETYTIRVINDSMLLMVDCPNPFLASRFKSNIELRREKLEKIRKNKK